MPDETSHGADPLLGKERLSTTHNLDSHEKEGESKSKSCNSHEKDLVRISTGDKLEISEAAQNTNQIDVELQKTPKGILGPLQKLRIRNQYVRKFLAECFGTFVLVGLGDSIAAQVTISRGTKGDIKTLMIGWGVAVMLGVYVSHDTSGGHINPAMTVTQAVLGRLKWSLVPLYLAGQYLGGFLGACLVYVTYYEARVHFELACNVTHAVTGDCATAQIWSTYPQEFISDGQGFVDQIVGTAWLIGMALAITDKNMFQIPKHFIPPLIGGLVAAILAAYEYNVMAALNPARDLAPRLFTAMVGYGSEVFTHPTRTWWLVPIFGPHVGGLVGAAVYYLFVGLHVDGKAIN